MEYILVSFEHEAQEPFSWSSLLDSPQREHWCETSRFLFSLSTFLFLHTHSIILYWIHSKRKWLFPFHEPKEKVLDPHYLSCSPSKKLNFHLRKGDRSTTSFHCFCSFSPPCSSCVHRVVSPSLDRGRLHKSATQEIPTLYFLSDKKPVMGDESVSAGLFDRLWGNNKAISVCQ